MTRVIGGSYDGTERPGYPHNQRLLVVSVDGGGFETYRREKPGGDWVFLHIGVRSTDDGSWMFGEG